MIDVSEHFSNSELSSVFEYVSVFCMNYECKNYKLETNVQIKSKPEF